MTRPGLGRLTAVFAWVGLASLGGGRSAYFHDALVTRRRWLSDEEFLQDLAISQILPGPNFSNLAVALGFRLAGFAGAACALVALVLPGVVILLALAAIYLRGGFTAGAGSAMQGMGAAVVGLVAVMSTRIIRAGLRGRLTVLLAAATAAAVGPLGLPTVWVIAAASAVGLWLHRPRASDALTPRGAA